MFYALLLAALFACDGGDVSTDDSGSDVEDTDGSSDTNGPVLSGLERYCDAYKECGGTYYETADDCVQASVDYWGSCPSRRDALDDFGACMKDVPCDDYNPDTYNPASTECSQEWSDLGESDPC